LYSSFIVCRTGSEGLPQSSGGCIVWISHNASKHALPECSTNFWSSGLVATSPDALSFFAVESFSQVSFNASAPVGCLRCATTVLAPGFAQVVLAPISQVLDSMSNW
jgi:hypothetical protein